MDQVDIIVPVKNESENIEELVRRIHRAMELNGIAYNIIFIDDASTDDTVERIRKLAKDFPIILRPKAGKPGKAFSILEGGKLAGREMIAMIDGDLQYPPEAIPELLELASYGGMAIANRKIYDTSFLRELGSRGNRFVFGKMLMRLPFDIQSGLKVFRREVLDHISDREVTPWTIDLHLLYTAMELGYRIGSVDIYFAERKRGKSKVQFIKTALEIMMYTLKLRCKRRKIYELKPTNGDPLFGAGLAFKRRRYITHTPLSARETAFVTLTTWQKIALFSIVLLMVFGLVVDALLTIKILIAALSAIYFLDVVFSFYLLVKSLHFPPEILVRDDELRRINFRSLPVYSILCPLYREARMVPHFLKALDSLDWPKEKLDVILLLEEDDRETIDAVEALRLPQEVRVFVVPDSPPKTKPKACNFGLIFAKGEYMVIFDAEDRPEPMQLKKAYLTFSKYGKRYFCLQSKLNFYNPGDNLLTRLFTAEYSLWFDIILQGIQSIEATIPLGGTSNHFRTEDLRKFKGWDPFNVTEDCDLGVRIFKNGYKTAIIDSTTYEEANSSLPNWLRQRSRWIKGYLQTYFVHMRSPLRFLLNHGMHALLFQLIIGMRMAFMLVNPFLWMATVAYFALHRLVGPTIEALYPAIVFYMAAASLVFGNFMYIYNYMIGCAKRRFWSITKYVFLIPLYWLMASVAAYVAVYQLLRKPHYWEKTVHGLHLVSGERKDRVPALIWNSWRGSVRGAFDLVTAGLVSWTQPRMTTLARIQSAAVGLTSVTRERVARVSAWLKEAVESVTLTLSLSGNGHPDLSQLNILIMNWRDTRHVWAGGAEVYIHELAKRWVSDGHRITVFCGNDGKSPASEIIDGVHIVRKGGFYTVYIWAFFYYLFRLRKKCDMVIDSENGVPFMTPLYVRKPKFLLAYHVHQEIFRSHLPFPLSQTARFIESRLMPLIYENQRVMTISNSSKLDLINLGFTRPEHISVVTPGVTTNGFVKGTKTDYPSFVYLGRHKPYKNIDVAIRAFKELVEHEPHARLTVAGEGESTQALIHLTHQLGLTKSVSFRGKVSEAEKVGILSESWAALQPSSIEGWGLTVVEANASGTPVIAANVKGLWDSITHGENGILVEPGNVHDFAYAMRWIVADESQRIALSRRAFTWSRHFHWGTKSQEFLLVIKDELARRYGVVQQPRIMPEGVGVSVYQPS